MKKVILFAIALSLCVVSFAQKKNKNTAAAAMAREEYEEARKAIDLAVNDETTKTDPETWDIRGDIYMSLAKMDKYKNDPSINEEIAKSYLKAYELKPTYNKEDMTKKLLIAANYYYQNGADAYNKQDYTKAIDNFERMVAIYNLENGKRFSTYSNKLNLDTVAVSARNLAAFSAYFKKDYDKAETGLTSLKTNLIAKDPNIYLALADIYGQRKDNDKLKAIIEEGRKEFPDNEGLRNEELNFFIRTGKQDELAQKFEEAAAKDPENADLQFNLGNAYKDLAFPKTASGDDAPKPANYAELIQKSEKAYASAIGKKPEQAEYNFNFAALYFNQAAGTNNEINSLGTSAADQKRYDELMKLRNDMFAKALPYLEKTYAILDPKAASLSKDDKTTYLQTLTALREIYAKQNKMDKVKEMKAKADAVK